MRRGGVLILLIGLILIVGAVMLFLFFQGQGGGASSNGPVVTAEATVVPLVDVVRARVDIKANTVISDAAQLELAQIPQTEFNAAKDLSAIADVQGKLATRGFVAGQVIEKTGLTEPGLSQQIPTAEPQRAHDKAYPFIVNNLSGVSDQIKPGDFVDVVATFTITRRDSFPSFVPATDQAAAPTQVGAPGSVSRVVTDLTYNTTKTIVQRAQVLKIIRPTIAAPDATPVAGAAPEASPQSGSLPQVDASGKVVNAAAGGDTTGSITQGAWTLILSVNDQEVELLEFALATNSRMVLVLRGAGDSAFEPTIGTTFDLLVSEFGLPLPQSLPPNVIGPAEALTPQPTRTPAPTRVP